MHFRRLPNEHNNYCKTLLTTVKAVKHKTDRKDIMHGEAADVPDILQVAGRSRS